MVKITKFTIVAVSLLILTSCGHKKLPPTQGGYIYKGLYFGSYFTRHYKDGIEDGCTTATGDYKKDHWLFNNSKDYKSGWFLGRNRCRSLLKIDKNGNLIL